MKTNIKYPVSYSQLSSFEFDPEQWYRRYVLKKRDPATPAMEYGKLVGERLASDPDFLPKVPRGDIYEYELNAKLGDVPYIGYIDAYTPHHTLHEYKTSENKKRWTQATVDAHTQLDMYAMLLYLQHKVRPEDLTIALTYIPVRRKGDFTYECYGEPKTFQTKRTLSGIMRYATYVEKLLKTMERYACKKQADALP